MRAQFAFLAEAVAKTADQRMVAHGIYLGPIEAAQLPLVVPQIYFVVGLAMTKAERDRAYTITARTIDPDSGPQPLGDETLLVPAEFDAPESDLLATIEYRIENVVFEVPGNYRFELLVDGALMGFTGLIVRSEVGGEQI